MKIQDKNKFESDITTSNISRFEKFKVGFNKCRDEVKEEFTNHEWNLVDNEMKAFYETDHELNITFHAIQKLLKRDRDLNYEDAIKLCAVKHKVSRKSLYDYTFKLVSMDRYKKAIKDYQAGFPESYSDPKQDTEIDFADENYSLARIVITLYYLLNPIYEKNDENIFPDKTLIALFIKTLVSSHDENKKIKNSYYYDKVLELYNQPEKATNEDLRYVREKFNSIGLVSIVRQIDSLLLQKKSKAELAKAKRNNK